MAKKLTKEVLDEIIKRRYSEGKTLSIERIEDERYSRWQILNAAREYYGSWSEACNDNGARNKHARAPKRSRAEIVDELRRLQAEGHSMKTADFDSRLYQEIKEEFGGYKQAKRELGIRNKTKRRVGSHNKRKLDDVIAELRRVYAEIDSFQGVSGKIYAHIPL